MQTSDFFRQQNQKGLFTFYKEQLDIEEYSSKDSKDKEQNISKSIKQKIKKHLYAQMSQQIKENQKKVKIKQEKNHLKMKRYTSTKKKKSKKQSLKSTSVQKLSTIIEESQAVQPVLPSKDDSIKKFLLHIVQRNISNMSHLTTKQQPERKQKNKQITKAQTENHNSQHSQQLLKPLRYIEENNFNSNIQNTFSFQKFIFKKIGEDKKQKFINPTKVLVKFFQIQQSNNPKPNLRYSKEQNSSALRSVTEPIRAQPSLSFFCQNTISQNVSPSKCQIKLPSIHRYQKKAKKSSSNKGKQSLKQSSIMLQNNEKIKKAISSKIIKSFHQQKYEKQKSNAQNSRSKISTINLTENCIFRKSSFGWMQKKKEVSKKWGIKL